MDRTNHVSGRPAVVMLVSVLAALSLFAVACGSSSKGGAAGSTSSTVAKNGTNITVANPGPPKSGGTLKFGLNAETNGWSPVTDEWAGSAYIVAGAIFDHLAEYNDKDVPQPYLAESITSNATFTQWTIKMRPGVTFQDGEKCDAQAVADNFNAQRASALTGAVFQTVSGVKVIDPLTVQVDHEPAVVDVHAHAHHPARRHGRAQGHARQGPDHDQPGRRRRRHPPGRHRSVHVRELDAERQAGGEEEPELLAEGLPLPRRHPVPGHHPDRLADRARCRPVRSTPSSRATRRRSRSSPGWPRRASSSSSPTRGCSRPRPSRPSTRPRRRSTTRWPARSWPTPPTARTW